MKLFALLFLQLFVFSTTHADLIKLKNKIFDAEDAMKVFGYDQSAEQRFWPIGENENYIVQFGGVVKNEWKKNLISKGVEFYGYVPDNAFIVKINSELSWKTLNDSDFVKAVVPYSPDLKIDSSLGVPSVFNKDQVTKYFVSVTSEKEIPAILDWLKIIGVELVSSISERSLVFVGNSKTAYDLAEQNGVEWVEPYFDLEFLDFQANPFDGWANTEIRSTNLVLSGYETGTKLMNFDVAHKLGYNGQGVIVGVTDTGLDRGSLTEIHSDFKGQVIKGYIRGMFSKSWADQVGHGTHVAGSVVGLGTASEGKIRGGAYGAKIVAQSTWTPMVNNGLAAPSLDDLLVAPFKNDSATINTNSWAQATNGTRYNAYTAMLDDILWKNPELLALFATGNEGADLDKDGRVNNGSLQSPSGAKNIVSVGASKNYVLSGGIQRYLGQLKDSKWPAAPLSNTTFSDNPNGMAPFSGTGPMQDGRIKPDIVAPGTNILSTRSQHPKAGRMWGIFNDDYIWSGGTSMAAPLAAAAAAVTQQYLKSKTTKPLSAALIKAAMIHNAHDLFPGQFGEGVNQEFQTKRPNGFEGFGRVDVGAVVTTPYYFIDEKEGLATGQQKEYVLGLDKIAAGTKMRVTLVYTDAPASAAALTALVNDLDVSVIDPAGKTYYPNHLQQPDKVNNVEMIEFIAPVSGAYKLFVRAQNVPTGIAGKGTQPYALLWNYK